MSLLLLLHGEPATATPPVRYRLTPGTRAPQSTLEPATGHAQLLTASTSPQHTLEAE